ncbi:hypothetical protein N7497_000523 [Penicillium chrysogenum]|nr:hypothetical protein N7497_000523 [Penicillium chrysogenum]
MQLTTLFTVCVAALTSTAAAMPHLSGAYHGARIAVRVPGNATSHNATATGTRAKLPCRRDRLIRIALISTVAMSCVLCNLRLVQLLYRMMISSAFSWSVYLQCTEKCNPENFYK